MSKLRHDGDCSYYSSMVNHQPEDGICTCGYALTLVRKGDYSQMYSQELTEKLDMLARASSDAKTKEDE